MSVCVCIPTRNRKWTQAFSLSCMDTQKLKPSVWIVLDASDSDDQAWDPALLPPGTVYKRIDNKPIGEMRNRCIALALEHEWEYMVFWDDDDFYPPTRISTGVKGLESAPDADIAASSKMHLFLTRENVLLTSGPFHDNHGTAATYTIRRRYFEKNRFDPKKVMAEELSFTREWTAKMVQVDSDETIVVMGHPKNTVDKSQILKDPAKFVSKIVNDVNGKQVFRSKWAVPQSQWDLWKSTFSVS